MLVGFRMRVRPASVYRHVLIGICALCLLFGIYAVFSYDGGGQTPLHHTQKHLYLTVSKDRIGSRFGTLAPKRILLWTTIFGTYPKDLLSDCKGLTDRCIYDSDRSLISSVDAVLFHSKDITSAPLPDSSLRNSSQRYVFMSMETPMNSGRYGVPNEVMALPKNFFNWTATYLYSSDVIFKYGPFWITSQEAEQRGFKMESFYLNPARLEKKRKGIFGLISNCHTPVLRETAIEALSKYIPITIAGKCTTDKSLKNLCPPGDQCQSVFEQYPFYIAIENSVCKDYITEKYWHRVQFASIPIVMKRSSYESSNTPPHSFIAMDDYKSPKEMADHLNMLQTNKTAYAEYFSWRNGGWTLASWNSPGYRNTWCRLCERLWQDNQTESVVEDVYQWFEKESECEKEEFVKQWIAA